MALQVKKNKNQFIRKATASSSVNKTIQDVSNVDVSAILSGVESVQIDTPNVNTGQINVNTGQINVNTGQINVNTGQINVHLTKTQTCTEGVKPFAGYEQPTCTEAGGRSGKPEENFDPGGTMHAPTTYSQHSDYVPKLHSDSHSKPSTGSSAIKISASGNISENQAAENPRTLEDLPFMTGAAQRSRHSEAPGHPDGSHTDTYFSHLVHQHVPGSRHFEPHGHPDVSHTDTYVSQLTYQHMLNQSNTTPSPGQRTSERALYDHVDNNHAPPLPKTPPPELPVKPPRMAKNETWGQHSSPSLNRGANQQRSTAFKKDHSSRPQKQDGHQFSNNLDDDGEENEDIVWEYPGERKVIDHHMMASNIQYPNFKEQAQMQYREDGTWYNNEQGGYHDQSSKAGPMFGGQYGKQTWQIPGWQPGGPMQQMQGGLNEGNIGNTHSHGRNFGYTSSCQKEGNSGQLQDGQHAKGHFGQMHGMEDVGFKTAGQPAGSMGPVPTIHHAGTMGQMPYQQNEGSIQQMQGGLHGGAMGKMHPHAQFEAMHPCGQEYMGESQVVHHQPEDMGQFWDFPPEPWQGDGQGHANYSQGASNFPGPSTNMTDRESASEQFDQRMNNLWFQQMVQNMKELVEKEGLIVKDVFPDGNCLFTAVIDQLRVHGNFNFTPSTLRAAAVTFLKEHPKQHDGTHLEQFLTNESWDQYLDRMSRDGVWGEHIILGAMSEVLKCRIIVLGGMSGKSRTVVQPQHVYDEEQKEIQKEKEEANGCKTVKDEPLEQTAKSEGVQSNSLQSGAASSTSAAGAKTKGTDTSQRKDETGSHSKLDKEKNDEELHMGADLYIGLLGEMHYVSLRKKDWEERLNEKLRARIRKRKARKKQEAGQEDDSSSDDDLCLPKDLVRETLKSKRKRDHKGKTNEDNGFWSDLNDIGTGHADVVLPSLHLDFLVNYIFNSKYILSEAEEITVDFSSELFSAQMFGSEFLPADVRYPIHSSKRLSLDSLTDNDYKERKLTGVYVYCIPGDTRAVPDESRNMTRTDLILHERKSPPGFTRLIPTTPCLWYPAIVSDHDGNIYLKHLHCRLRKTTAGINSDGHLGLLISFRSRWPTIITEWLFRQRSAMWPNSDILEQVAAIDICIIPRGPNVSSSSSDIEWEISFAPHEKFIMATAVTRSQKLCFLLMTLLVDRRQNRLDKLVLQILKTVFFYACETIPVRKWDLEPVWCLVYMFSRIRDHLEARSLPHYFISSRNTLQDLADKRIRIVLAQIEILHFHPLLSLYSFCDEVGLCCLQPGKFFDDIFEVLSSSIEEDDLKLAFVNTFCPKLIEMSQRMAEKGFCDSASTILASIPRIEEGMGIMSCSVQIANMLRRLSDIDRWCLVFCIDRIKGLNMAEIMFSSFPQSKLSQLMGPVVERCIGDAIIPTKFTDLSTVCEFAHKFASILCLLASDKVAIEGLKFFLQKYQRSVCDFIINVERQASSSTIDSSLYLLAYATIRSEKITLALMKVCLKLFSICIRNGHLYHLFDLLDGLENAAEAMCSKVVYQMLANYFEILGNKEKMNLYKAHAASIDYTFDKVTTLQF